MKIEDIKLAIFPGHVGKDSGAIDRVQGHEDDRVYSIESVINGQVANLVKAKCDHMGIFAEIFYGSFENRINDSQHCNIGISLHCDAAKASQANGYTIFHFPGSIKGRELSISLNYQMDALVSDYIKPRGINPHNYYILSKTKFPCVLLEMGFLTNKNDEVLLHLYNTQNIISFAIVAALLKH